MIGCDAGPYFEITEVSRDEYNAIMGGLQEALFMHTTAGYYPDLKWLSMKVKGYMKARLSNVRGYPIERIFPVLLIENPLDKYTATLSIWCRK